MRRSAIRDALGAAAPVDTGPTVLPPDCPVRPLGSDGETFWYLNAARQMVAIKAQAHSKNIITSLFAPRIDFLVKNWPKTFDPETNRPTDYKADHVARALMCEAQARGRTFSPHGVLRGLGVWAGDDGDLVVHLGPRLLIGRRQVPCDLYGGHVYPMREERAAPAADAQADVNGGGPAAEFLALAEAWAWQEPFLAPRLLLGWVIATYLAGVLPWRPHLWVVAERGSGKSTLLDFLALVLGRAAVKFENTTDAAVRGTLEIDAIGALIDEAEASENNQRLDRIIEFARIASSGGTVARGTIEQKVIQQTARCCMLFSSINRPSMLSQDVTRITTVRMQPHARGAAAPMLLPSVLGLLGQRLFRRALDGWSRYLDTLRLFRAELIAGGLDGRWADQLGALLACAWIAAHDLEPDHDSLAVWCERAVAVTGAERDEDRPEWFRMLEHLAGSLLAHDAGGRREWSVAELVAVASARSRKRNPDTGEWESPLAAEMEAANATLARHGLRFVAATDERGRPWRRHWDRPHEPPSVEAPGFLEGHVAIANAHPSLARLFQGTRWGARAGATGVWKAAAETAPGAQAGRPIRFGPRSARCVLVPAALLLGEDECARS